MEEQRREERERREDERRPLVRDGLGNRRNAAHRAGLSDARPKHVGEPVALGDEGVALGSEARDRAGRDERARAAPRAWRSRQEAYSKKRREEIPANGRRMKARAAQAAPADAPGDGGPDREREREESRRPRHSL